MRRFWAPNVILTRRVEFDELLSSLRMTGPLFQGLEEGSIVLIPSVSCCSTKPYLNNIDSKSGGRIGGKLRQVWIDWLHRPPSFTLLASEEEFAFSSFISVRLQCLSLEWSAVKLGEFPIDSINTDRWDAPKTVGIGTSSGLVILWCWLKYKSENRRRLSQNFG